MVGCLLCVFPIDTVPHLGTLIGFELSEPKESGWPKLFLKADIVALLMF